MDEEQLERLRGLSELSRAFTYSTSLDQVARLAAERGASLLDAGASVLMLSDPDGSLRVRASFGVEEERVRRFRVPADDELDARLQGLLDVPPEALMAVPLVVQGAVSGLVAVGLRAPATPADEWLLSALADQAAVALEHARLGGEVRQELEARLRASEQVTNAKDRALATLAHDIRSPLGAIEGYCELLEGQIVGPMNDRQLEAVGRVRMSGQHLLSLLDNVMDMARFNAGVVTVSSEPVSLAEVARDAVHMLLPAAGARLQTLELGELSDVVVRADRGRLRQVLVNLIGNAVKFTPERGTIVVTASRRRIGQQPWGEVRVSDSGPGIAEAERASIFEPYYRGASVAHAPGVGLGLAISRALVEQMNGVMELQSQLGVGSSFIIRLPPEAPEAGS